MLIDLVGKITIKKFKQDDNKTPLLKYHINSSYNAYT